MEKSLLVFSEVITILFFFLREGTAGQGARTVNAAAQLVSLAVRPVKKVTLQPSVVVTIFSPSVRTYLEKWDKVGLLHRMQFKRVKGGGESWSCVTESMKYVVLF